MADLSEENLSSSSSNDREPSPANSVMHTGSFPSKDNDHMNYKKLVQMQAYTFDMEEFSDCKVVVGAREFKVNKYFLCLHSDAFKSYFMHNTQENQTQTIKIDDLDANIIEAMLKFFYSGQVENLKDIAHDLYIVADRYQVNELKSVCLRYMSNSLNIETIIKSLELAFQLDLEPLKSNSILFAVENIHEVRKLDHWSSMAKRYSDISLAILDGVLEQQKKKKASTEAENEADNAMTKHLMKELSELRNTVQCLMLEKHELRRELRNQANQAYRHEIEMNNIRGELAQEIANRPAPNPENQPNAENRVAEVPENQPVQQEAVGLEFEIEVEERPRRRRGRPRRQPNADDPPRRRKRHEVIELDE